MIPFASGVRVWLAMGRTDMRKGMNGLALQVKQALGATRMGRSLCLSGCRGDLIKIIWHDGLGMSLYAKRLEKGRFIWPSPAEGVVAIRPGSSAICWKELTGGCPNRAGGRSRRADRASEAPDRPGRAAAR